MNLLCVILFAVVLMLVGVCLWQRRVIHNKNRAIVKSIDESIKYKKLYYSLLNQINRAKSCIAAIASFGFLYAQQSIYFVKYIYYYIIYYNI